MSFIEELRWRGMLQDMTPGIEEHLEKEISSGYIGFDPTAASLHIGNLVQIMFLVHFQRAGHKPVALVGGATGMIGDPSGKSKERNLLNEEQLQKNVKGVKRQLEKFLDFDKGASSAELVNNYDWFKEMDLISFLRDTGKHLTVSYMLAKESVQSRLETGISFTEFGYQLIQAYDFFHLNDSKGVKVQMGGSDQWGNITAGTELIRRKSGGEAFAITCPLLTRSDGSKFGKTAEGDNIWLDAKMTSAYKFYQFWLNASDEEAQRYNRIFSLKRKKDIETLEVEHLEAPHLRALQKSLAEELTVWVHGEEALRRTILATNILFGKSTKDDLLELSEEDIIEIFAGVPQFLISRSDLADGVNVVDLLAGHTSILPSKGEARKLIKGNGLSINKEKIQSADLIVEQSQLLNSQYLLVQKGKKNYFLIKIETD